MMEGKYKEEGLHVDSILKSYGTWQILTDIYLSCKKGEIVGLLGRNGCGKSTLLKIIFGTLGAERKFLRVDNRQILRFSDNKGQIRYLPQHHFLPTHIKVRKMIDLFCEKQTRGLIANHRLIKPLIHQTSNQLSGGERRVLEIFLIVFSSADIILLDEPFNGVSPLLKDEIKEIIKSQSLNKGIVMTDHDYRNILDISTRKLLLYDGGIKNIRDEKDLKNWGYLPG